MNLTKTSYYTRNFIAYSLVALILYSVGYFAWPALKAMYLNMFPPKQEPVIAFGKMPVPKFDGYKISPSTTPEYVLNTKDGRLPAITPQLFTVLKVGKPPVSFFSGQNAQKNAEILKFVDSQNINSLTGNVYKWVDEETSRTLQINITTNTLEYTADPFRNIERFKNIGRNLEFSSREDAKVLLSKLGYFEDTLYKDELTKTVIGKYQNNQIVETKTHQEYKLAKVDFFRKISDYPIYGPKYDDGLLQVIVGHTGERTEDNPDKFLRIRAVEWPVLQDDTRGRYPAKHISEAWKEIQENKGSFAKVKLLSGNAFEPYKTITVSKVLIESVKIAYFESPVYQPYLQPIYVFEGTFLTPDNQKGQVVLYTPAISNAYLEF